MTPEQQTELRVAWANGRDLPREYVNEPGRAAILTVRCPRRRHALARVFRTPWGDYILAAPPDYSPAVRRQASEHLEDDDERAYADRWGHVPDHSGFLVREVPARRLGPLQGLRTASCRCGMWRADDVDIVAALDARAADLVLDVAALG